MRPLALVLVGSRRVNKRMVRFLEGLDASGFEPVVASLPRHPWETSALEDPSAGERRGVFTLGPARTGRRRPARPALVVCMHWSMLPLAVVLARIASAPLIYDDHDHYELLVLEATGPGWLTRWRVAAVRAVHRWCLPRADLVTCIRLAGGVLAAHLSPWNPAVVELHNRPSPRWSRTEPRLETDAGDGALSVVYLGGVWGEKGCATMLDAFELLAGDPTLPPLELHVFGRGDREIERRLASAPAVHFHGATDTAAIVDHLTGHDCLGLVLFEPTPRYSLVSTNCVKLFEYLATGVAVVASDLGEVGEIIEGLDAGWVLPAGLGADELASRLREIVADPHEVRRRGDAAAAGMRRDRRWWAGEWEKVEASGVLDAARARAGSAHPAG